MPYEPDEHERLRLRDEDRTGLRLIIRDRGDGEPGADVLVLATGRDWEAIRLDEWDVDLVIAVLRRGVVGSCRWCDSLGMVDGPRGPELCEHPSAVDA